MPSDHYIPFNKSFYESCSVIRDQFRKDALTLMGILPDKASTEYGYISYKSSYDGLKQVDSFIEKPNLERAKLLLKQPNTLWNAGIFCFEGSWLKKEIKINNPKVYSRLNEIVSKENLNETYFYPDPKEFSKLDDLSFDKGFVERNKNNFVVTLDAGWTDLGSWHTLSNLQKMPEHGLTQSEEVGSNLGSWDHKRDGSVRTGLKLSRLVTVNFNFSQNFSSVISGTGIEQRTMTRDYIAVDDLFQKGLPFPGWSFRLAGVEKWPIIKWVAKSASIDHSYAGKESRSWQFEDVSPVDIDFFKLANFVDDYKDYERSSRINMNFSPLIGFNMSLKKNISLTFRHNRNLALDELPTGLTIRKDHSYTSTASYTHRGGMTIPIPYYGKIKLNNNISFTLNFDMNDSKEFKSGDKIDLEEGAFSSNWKAGLRMSYQFSNKISGGLRYEYRESDS